MEEFLQAIHNAVKAEGAKDFYSKAGFKTHIGLLQHTNPHSESHTLNLPKFLLIAQNLSTENQFRVLSALAAGFGYDLVGKAPVQPQALTSSLINVGKEVADLTIAVHEALDDNHVSAFEKAQIRVEIDHVRKSLDVMDASVRAA
ncbi:phage regulatory CII family protein [Pseudomonas sp. LS-2]|uniref:phage regulatory CII family protein n=1 Tax=Pseudomonas sp. LS-2 TaxID=2315859 RepID=UPI000E744A01|nr:phage regulatory CII family protein [Pseudomonas sp. LS-2]RJX83471.1 Rha family transcriptional regulator [Pseudomonas sp. LS-2]